MIQQKIVGFFFGCLLALTLISFKSHAAPASGSDWGDLGYAQAIDPVVESLPSEEEELAQRESLEMAPPQELEPVKSEPLRPEPVASEPMKSFSRISTVKNTYGVLTEERTPIRFYAAPLFGFGSVMGTDTADVMPRYALGGSVGFLISNNIRLEGAYVYQVQDFTNPRINTLGGSLPLGLGPTLALKQNQFSAGAKLFILGRESRLRPYVGGGVNWTRGTLNYSTESLQFLSGQPQYLTDFTLNQFGGFGELGTEIAITRAFVAQVSFKLSGVITSSTSNDKTLNLAIDPGKSDIGNSVSRSASYLLGAGLGIYF